MKTKTILLTVLALTFSANSFSQKTKTSTKKKSGYIHASSEESSSNYKTGIGLRAGFESGLTLKHFIKTNNALEGILSRGWGYGGFRITGLYEFQKSFPDAQGLNWFVGIGAHIGAYNGNYYGYYGYSGTGYYDKHGKWHSTGYRNSYTSAGLDLIIGIEYQFANAPFTIGLDLKPYFDLYGPSSHYVDGALSIRYILK